MEKALFTDLCPTVKESNLFCAYEQVLSKNSAQFIECDGSPSEQGTPELASP